MKTTITITLDTDIRERLKREGNVSGLISELLRKHFELKGLEAMSLEELKALKEKMKRRRELEAELAKL